MPDHQQDVTADLKIIQEPSGTWALWSNEGKEFVVSGAAERGILNFLADMARHEAETRARGDITLVQAMSQKERDAEYSRLCRERDLAHGNASETD